MSELEYILQQLINALSVGSLYALVAVGLSIIFSLLRLTNFAHGDMMMIGAFATLFAQLAGMSFLAAVGVGILVSALAGVIIERVAYRPVRGAPDVTMLLTSVALTYILENLGILLFSSSPRNFPLPEWMNHLYRFADGRITFNNINLLTLGVTLLALLFLNWFVRRTRVGLGMRAAAEDLTAAYLVGLDVNRVIVVAFVLGGLEVLIQSLPGQWGLSSYRDALVFALLIAFLLFRPGGILGVRQEVKL